MPTSHTLPKPSRNDPCICGSGKKYKLCCLNVKEPGKKNAPETISLLINNARQFTNSGDLLKAENTYRLVLSRKSASLDALIGLASCLSRQGRYNVATPYFTKAAQLLLKRGKKTGNFKPVLDLAFQLNNAHAPEKALAIAETVLRLQKNSAGAYHIKALCLQKMNKTDAAYRAAKRTVELAPNESNAILLLATLESRRGELDTAKQRLKSVIQGGLAADMPRIHLELGVILDRMGDYENAFTCISDSGRLSSSSSEAQQIDRQAVFRDIQASKQFFSARSPSTDIISLDGGERPAPVFLLGFYRSGTTLMEQILAAHPSVISSDEAHIIPAVLRELREMFAGEGTIYDQINQLDTQQLQQLRTFYWQMAEEMVDQQLQGKVFVDKTALNILNLGIIEKLFPNAQILFAVRDPRDVCISCFMQSFSLSPLTIQFLDWQQTGRFYDLVMDYWLSIRDKLDLNWIELRYEDVLHDMQAQFQPVFAQLDLEWSEQCSEFHAHAQNKVIKTPSFNQVTQPIYKTSLQRWRNYQQAIQEIMPFLDRYINLFNYHLNG